MLLRRRAESLQHPDIAPLLDHSHGQRTEHIERRDTDDQTEDDVRRPPFDLHHRVQVLVQIEPGRHAVRRPERRLQIIAHRIRLFDRPQPDVDPAHRIVHLKDVPCRLQGDEGIVRVVVLVVRIVDAAHGALADDRFAELDHHRIHAHRTQDRKRRFHHRPQPVRKRLPEDDARLSGCIVERERAEDRALLHAGDTVDRWNPRRL